MDFDFREMFKARSDIPGRYPDAKRRKSGEATQFNNSIAVIMLSIISKAHAAAVSQCNKKYAAVRKDNLAFLDIGSVKTQESTGGFSDNVESHSVYGILSMLIYCLIHLLFVEMPLCSNFDVQC